MSVQTCLAAGYPAEASSEFDACDKRRMNAVAMFFDDMPTWRHSSALAQWTQTAIDALAKPGAAAPVRPDDSTYR